MKTRAEAVSAGPEKRATRTRRKLILALDGVPWQAIDEMRRGGHFAIFSEPARAIAPFPTLTNTGMHAMLGTRKPLGYENLYFDRDRGRMCGGSLKYIQPRAYDREQRGYNHLLDYEEPMQFEFLVYAAPRRIFSADLSKMLAAFKRSDASVFYGFLKSTDGLIHVGGREVLLVALRKLDHALSQLYEDFGGELEIILYSDHGNALVPFKFIPIKTHLAGYGLDPKSRLGGRRSLIIPSFGLVSCAVIYAAEENRREIAEALASLEGVGFSAFRPPEGGELTTEIIGPAGSARIDRDEDTGSFRYRQLTGDPLELGRIAAALRSQNLLDDQGYAPDGLWFEATKDHLYPDAVRNVWASVREHVESPADVLVSLNDGYCYGNAVFSRVISLAATHGSALRSTSYAFLMSTHQEVPPFMRSTDARSLLRAKEV